MWETKRICKAVCHAICVNLYHQQSNINTLDILYSKSCTCTMMELGQVRWHTFMLLQMNL